MCMCDSEVREVDLAVALRRVPRHQERQHPLALRVRYDRCAPRRAQAVHYAAYAYARLEFGDKRRGLGHLPLCERERGADLCMGMAVYTRTRPAVNRACLPYCIMIRQQCRPVYMAVYTRTRPGRSARGRAEDTLQ